MQYQDKIVFIKPKFISYSSWPLITLIREGVIIFKSPLNIADICGNLLNSRILRNNELTVIF